MGDMNNYKCRGCGAPLAFDPESGRLKCDFCGGSFDPEEYELQEQSGEAAGQWGVAEGMKSYVCPSCGAELICDDSTAATSCPYCGNNAVMPGQFSGTQKPEFILPFKVTKNQAMAALKAHYKGKFLLPKAFKRENHVQKIQGVYVPFWLFDRDASGEAKYEATNSRRHREGDYMITETEHYQVSRAGNISFRKIPVDASSKMPDGYMDSIEPYHYEELKDFSPSYMPGYLADKYDVDRKAATSRADLRCENSLESALRNTITGYDNVNQVEKNIQVKPRQAHYAMLPVWLLSTKWRDKIYLFAINGQTGKLVGDLPEDKAKLHGIFWSIFLIGGLVLTLLFGDSIGNLLME